MNGGTGAGTTTGGTGPAASTGGDGEPPGRAGARQTLHYTRCPVPTATGIALDHGLFDSLYAGTRYLLRDVAEAGGDAATAHYTHSIDRCFREGGGSPPVWARAGGADTRLLGITFMDETLGIFVRADDPAQGMVDLAGRRIGLPRWPGLVFNFWRFAAEMGFHSALRLHGMRAADLRVVDVVEGGASAPGGRACRYRRQLQALLAGRIDAMFGKGPEIALLEREAQGRIRLLFDVASSPDIGDRVNNSTPRLVTAGARMVREDPDAVVRYLQGLLRAGRLAARDPGQVRASIARDCGIDPDLLDRFLRPGYAQCLVPAITPGLLGTVEVLKSFLFERRYIGHDFALDDWLDEEPLRAALAREDGAPH